MFRIITACLIFITPVLNATEFTISSYNCGGLSDHYDYLRAVAMQKLMEERFTAEPEQMALHDRIQAVALKILFANNKAEKQAAQQEWDAKGYQQKFEQLTIPPIAENSPNAIWYQKSGEMITDYKVRPVTIFDEKLEQMVYEQLADLLKNLKGDRTQLLSQALHLMAKRIFSHHMQQDIICLQEADYLDTSLFPGYKVLFADTSHSLNGIAWKKARFELLESLGNIRGRAFAVRLQDKESGKTILVASGHLSGCNPYQVERTPNGGADSAKGDADLQAIIQLFEQDPADLQLIGMDANVTSLHPRLRLLKDASYFIDYENFIEPTATSPYQILNTRIDWIALKGAATITNIPVPSVGLNSLQTNISDHKPVAAKVSY